MGDWATRGVPWVVVLGALGCASRPQIPAVPFAESAAYRKLKSGIVAFHEEDVDDNGFPDGLIFSKEKPGFVPILYTQMPNGERTQWVRACIGEPLSGDRFETLRRVRDGPAERLLAVATTEDPDRLVVDYAVYDSKRPCEALLRDTERFDKPAGDVMSPGAIRLGLQVASDGTLLVVEAPATTRMRGRDGALDMVTAVTVRRWAGSDAVANERWQSVRKSLLKPIDVDVEWQPGDTVIPDVLVGDYRSGAPLEGAIAPTEPLNPAHTSHAANRLDPAVLADMSMRDAWKLRAGEVGTVRVRANAPFVLLEVHHGCTLGHAAPLEVTSADGPSLFVTGARPVANGVFAGAASGRQREGEPAVELGALSTPTRDLALVFGPVERSRCLRAIRAYGWALPSPAPKD